MRNNYRVTPEEKQTVRVESPLCPYHTQECKKLPDKICPMSSAEWGVSYVEKAKTMRDCAYSGDHLTVLQYKTRQKIVVIKKEE